MFASTIVVFFLCHLHPSPHYCETLVEGGSFLRLHSIGYYHALIKRTSSVFRILPVRVSRIGEKRSSVQSRFTRQKREVQKRHRCKTRLYFKLVISTLTLFLLANRSRSHLHRNP